MKPINKRPGERDRPLSPRLASICLGAIAILSSVLIWNVMADAFDKDRGWLAGGFIAALLVVWLCIEWMLADDLQDRRHWRSLLSPLKLARIGAISLGTPLAVSQALPLFDPGPLTKNSVKEAVNDTLDDRENLLADHSIASLSGLWGEPGCVSAYRFEVVKPSGLKISWERRPAGEKPWSATATIAVVKGARIETRGETPLSERGKAASFTVGSNGISEQLTWTDEARDMSMELV